MHSDRRELRKWAVDLAMTALAGSNPAISQVLRYAGMLEAFVVGGVAEAESADHDDPEPDRRRK